MPRVVRYVLLGPVLGACLSLTQTAVAAGVWVGHWRPDFYFRSWEAVERGLVLWAIGGAAVGVPFAATVAVGEYLFRRRVRLMPAVVCVVAVTAAVTWAIVEVEFARRELLPAFALEGVAVVIAGGVLLVWSQPMTPNPRLHPTAAQSGGRR